MHVDGTSHPEVLGPAKHGGEAHRLVAQHDIPLAAAQWEEDQLLPCAGLHAADLRTVPHQIPTAFHPSETILRLLLQRFGTSHKLNAGGTIHLVMILACRGHLTHL
jgi:hypothetical protein